MEEVAENRKMMTEAESVRKRRKAKMTAAFHQGKLVRISRRQIQMSGAPRSAMYVENSVWTNADSADLKIDWH